MKGIPSLNSIKENGKQNLLNGLNNKNVQMKGIPSLNIIKENGQQHLLNGFKSKNIPMKGILQSPFGPGILLTGFTSLDNPGLLSKL